MTAHEPDTHADAGGSAVPYRRQILQRLLENKDGLNIEELTRYLNISRAAVQQHFAILEREGLIAKHKRVKTLGRPSISYILTGEGLASFPKRYHQLSELILAQLSEDFSPESRLRFMQRMGRKLADKYRPLVAGKGRKERAAILLELMQGLGFHARMEDHAGEQNDIEIDAHNCIYHEVAQQYSDICTLDETFISELLGGPIRMAGCMANGDGKCCFKIHLEESETEGK